MSDAEQWFVGAARRAVEAGERLDATAMELAVLIAPSESFLSRAIDEMEPFTSDDGLAAHAHDVSSMFRGVEPVDHAAARAAVTRLEERILAAYRPGCGLGRLEDDVAIAHAMLDAHAYGSDDTHLMMAEELMLSVIRRQWPDLRKHPLPVACEAAVVLDALGRMTEKVEYRERAVEALEIFAETYRDLGWRAAPFVLALKTIS